MAKPMMIVGVELIRPDCYVMSDIKDPCVSYNCGVQGTVFRIVRSN